MDEPNQDPTFQRLLERHVVVLGSFSSPSEEVSKKLQSLVTNIKWTPRGITDLFDALKNRFESTPTNDRSQFSDWMLKILHLMEINYITPTWRLETGKTLLDLIRDQTVTEEKLKNYLEEEKDKQLDEILHEIRQEPLNQVDEELLEKVRDIVSSVGVDKQLPVHDDGSELNRLKKVLQKICKAVESTKRYSPRLTQLVSWCLLALSKTGRLIQVGTGEGKSCIVAMFAAFRVLEGQKVHIMSTSAVLANRDLKDWKPFFKKLGIKADCNVMKLEGDLKQCYECPVVYGTVEEFAGDWLKQRFHKMEIFGQRTFQCAIVDEADSLMLDKSHHVVYLSTDMPALQHLDPLLALVWATANQYSKINSEIRVGKKLLFPQVLLENIKSPHLDELSILQIAEDTGLLAKGSANQIRRDSRLLTQKLQNVTVHQLAKFFETVETRFPFCRFSLHCNVNGQIEELNKRPPEQDSEGKKVQLLLSSDGLCQYMYSDEASVLKAAEEEVKPSLCFTPCELSHDKHTCHIPNFLSKLVNSQLKVWIENAFKAQTMTENDEYVIETHGIVPVDYSNTGVVENNRQWADGLHQFLEMKHGSKMNPMTIVTNYMSNVGLLQMYGNQIYGMSGTLGQQADTEALQEIYKGINTCRIPSFRRRKLFEVEAKIVSDEEEWIETICDVVTEQTSSTSFRDKRAALVICNTINHAEALKKALKNTGSGNKLYINNNMDNEAILKTKIGAGEVILATNLAGRGTDLQVSDSVKAAGGLFVVQTFLPINARVEAQAFGRTARQGSPGSAQLIVCIEHLSPLLQLPLMMMKLRSPLVNTIDLTSIAQNRFAVLARQYQNNSTQNPSLLTQTLLLSLKESSVSEIKVGKEIRDTLAAESLSTYLKSVVPKIKNKEELFSQYLDVVDDLYRSANNKPAPSDLAALNEFWAMWLITDYKDSGCIESMKAKLAEELSSARQKLSQRQSPSSNLHHYTVFGNELRKKKNFKESIEMYTKATQEDHPWAAIALYNRAFAYLTQQNGKQDHVCIMRALEDLRNALKSVELYLEQTAITEVYYTQSKRSDRAVSRFDVQLAARKEVLLLFKSNVMMAIGKLDRVNDFGGTVKVEKKQVYVMVPARFLLPLLVHQVESLSAVYSRDILRILQLNSHPKMDIFNELRSLDSLGLTHVYSLDTSFSVGGFFSKTRRLFSRFGFSKKPNMNVRK